MKKLVIVGAGVALGLTAALAWKATQPSSEPAADAPAAAAETGGGAPAGTAVAPVRLEAQTEDPDVAYLKTREVEAQEAAAEYVAKHEPNEEGADPEQDHTVNVPALRRARDAFHRDDFETAIKELEAAIAIEPEPSARAMLVEAACTIGDETLARHHVAQLDDLRQKLAARRCDQLGVVLPGIDWQDGSLPAPPKGTLKPSPPPKDRGVRAKMPIRRQVPGN